MAAVLVSGPRWTHGNATARQRGDYGRRPAGDRGALDRHPRSRRPLLVRDGSGSECFAHRATSILFTGGAHPRLDTLNLGVGTAVAVSADGRKHPTA
ncbi:hypothetical protein GCM10011579_063130 [Streptomyces albiflavescens]|uniref:Uncharacterized protein n=1 Tax=Streptomyces albiflavescens TaxID=1623582 RepID=A0A918D7W0_9ACTN|nr:hypothetical protein GCM10011579_063130 [Streptomyces albiflavescens]